MEKITKSSDKVLIDPNEPLILPDGTALVGRLEWFLYALCCLDYQNLPTPMSRIEEFANALITGEVPNIEPQSRAEQFFLAILDGNVSDLPQPQSRSEVLLDKLARGEFDLSDVEPIQSSYELLLAYLIKNGGIGNIDYVLYEFSEAMKTMYNTVEKPFKSLELSGNTLVNCVLEDTENDDYVSFDQDYEGQSFTINGTSEGAIKSAILKGQTLKNINDYSIITSSNVTIDNDGVITINAQSKYTEVFIKSLENKTSTKYLVKIKVIENTLSGDFNLNAPVNGNVIFDNAFKIIKSGYVGEETIIYTTASDLTNAQFTFRSYLSSSVASGSIKYQLSVIEYQDGMENWDIPYFEGMQSVKMPVLTTIGENLFTGFINRGYINADGNVTALGNNQNMLSDFIEVKFNSIAFRRFKKDGTPVNSFGEFAFYDKNKNFISRRISMEKVDESITLPNNTRYIRIWSKPVDIDDGGWDELAMLIYSNEAPSQIKSYLDNKTNILTVNEDVTLRGVGNGGHRVEDVLDLKTGELISSIGEVLLDGTQKKLLSQNWGSYTKTRFELIGAKEAVIGYEDVPLLSDKLKPYGYWGEVDKGEYFFTINNAIDIVHSRDKDIVQWLNDNPTLIVYPLLESTVKTVDLNVVDQNNTEIDKIHVFNETTHVNASSDELTPTVNIGKSVSYPTIIKPNTKYTVNLKRNDKPLTVNLGGTEVTFTSGETRKIITTPSTLTNDKLSYYGIGAKCNKIMLIEGEVEGNVDYFTGMQSVVMQNQMPILHTVGKNLIDNTSWESGRFDNSTGEVLGNSEFTRYAKYIQVKPSTTYVWKDDTDDFKAIYEYGATKDYIGLYGNTAYTSTSVKFTTSATTKFIRIWIKNTTISSTNQLEESVSATTYEPYKTSILSCNEDVVLREIGDVRDTLDLMTGEVTERVGEIVLDGSQDVNSWWNTTSTIGVGTPIPTMKNISKLNCDKLPVVSHEAMNNDTYDKDGVASWDNGNIIRFRIEKSKLSTEDVNGVKQYLQSNPITIQYELTNKSVKTVDLSVVDQDGNTIPKVKSHNGTTHLEVKIPKQSLLPNISAEVATDNSKDMSLLTVKHQEISEAQATIQDNIQSQSDEIDTALMATTEIFESILE